MGTWRMALFTDTIQKTATMPFQFENCSVRAIVRDGASIQRGLGLLRADREGGRDPCGRLRGGRDDETRRREYRNDGEIPPVIGGNHDQNLYRVQAIGEAHGRDAVWLEGKGDLDVDIRAISAARPGVDGYGLLRDE